jgi:hypothetical protein
LVGRSHPPQCRPDRLVEQAAKPAHFVSNFLK